jgi:hypothetical protein
MADRSAGEITMEITMKLTAHEDFRFYPVISETPHSMAVDVDGTAIVFPAVRRGALGKQRPAKEIRARIVENRGPEGGWHIQVSHVVYDDGSSSGYSGQVIGPVEVLKK